MWVKKGEDGAAGDVYIIIADDRTVSYANLTPHLGQKNMRFQR